MEIKMEYISVTFVILVTGCALSVAGATDLEGSTTDTAGMTGKTTDTTEEHPSPEYFIPAEPENPEYSRTLNKSYDDVWRSVIDHVSAISFAIDNFEKDSGLVTLSFQRIDISSYVDCGQLDIAKSEYMSGVRFKRKFKGKYTDYLNSRSEATLSGKINISVREVSEDKSWLFFGDHKTYVSVNVLYILRDSSYSGEYSYTWSFVSGSSDTERGRYGDPIRCQPTYFLERSILDAASSN